MGRKAKIRIAVDGDEENIVPVLLLQKNLGEDFQDVGFDLDLNDNVKVIGAWIEDQKRHCRDCNCPKEDVFVASSFEKVE